MISIGCDKHFTVVTEYMYVCKNMYTPCQMEQQDEVTLSSAK